MVPSLRSRRSLAAFLILTALLPIGGCPSPADDAGSSSISRSGTTLPGASFTGSQTAGASSSTGPAAAGGAFSDGLTARYAECLEPTESGAWRNEILRLVNEERVARGLGPVKFNATLEAQAEEYACELIHYDFFAHVNPVTKSTLSDRAEQFGYIYRVVGENLAAGQQSPAEAFRDWMESPGHRANILDGRFTELGIGIRSGGTYGLYWVQEFGAPLESAAGGGK
ncbi:MAG: CAP domain-containing protein [Phycisphaerales bacterium]|nr:CAP domain-containing protein [Phycisphaerales bacterium]